MTTANLMNVPSVNGQYAPGTDASKKLQEENLEVAAVFASMMNQTVDAPNPIMDDTSSNTDVSMTDSKQSATNSYERYSYKENQIDEAKEPSVDEKLEEASDTLEQAEQDVMNAISEEYGVSEEEIQNLLDDLGLSVLDLLNPENLVAFIVQLTGVASGEELLLDESFLSVMETVNHLAEGLMKELNVDMEGLQELVSQMKLVTQETEVPATFQETLASYMAEAEEAQKPAQDVENPEMLAQNADEAEVQTDKQMDRTEVEVQTTETKKINVRQETGDDASLTGNRNFHSNANETVVTTHTTLNVNQVTNTTPTQFTSYLAADTIQIMEQIVQQMRVTISAETTSMEMQLNPENLGKVYVNISSEEGVVNAQFHATNEVVKEALEAQVATLRENLNQAGVKVDAIEVTIASHEFERNLEQNHQNQKENVEEAEKANQKRRNLTIDSLDELSGVMTEEETIVAQIMKDNGNSVDLTA